MRVAELFDTLLAAASLIWSAPVALCVWDTGHPVEPSSSVMGWAKAVSHNLMLKLFR